MDKEMINAEIKVAKQGSIFLLPASKPELFQNYYY